MGIPGKYNKFCTNLTGMALKLQIARAVTRTQAERRTGTIQTTRFRAPRCIDFRMYALRIMALRLNDALKRCDNNSFIHFACIHSDAFILCIYLFRCRCCCQWKQSQSQLHKCKRMEHFISHELAHAMCIGHRNEWGQLVAPYDTYILCDIGPANIQLCVWMTIKKELIYIYIHIWMYMYMNQIVLNGFIVGRRNLSLPESMCH